MPRSTFFNLPEKKREKLICAIKDEFSRVPFDEVSINKIIHTAEIPRGSFYQYFVNKNDMLRFILFEFKEQMLEHIKTSLRGSQGDIFIMFSDILDFTIGFAMEEKTNSFCKNLFADIKVNSNFYFEMSEDDDEKKVIEKLNPFINFELLDLHEEDDFTNMFDILFSIWKDATVEVFMNISDYEKAKQKYRKKLELLRDRFTKNKE